MKQFSLSSIFILLIMELLLFSCIAPTTTQLPPTLTLSPIPPTSTLTSTPTITPTPIPLANRDLSTIVMQTGDIDIQDLTVFTGRIMVRKDDDINNMLTGNPETHVGAVNYYQVWITLEIKEEPSDLFIQVPNYTSAIIVYGNEEQALSAFELLSMEQESYEEQTFNEISSPIIGTDSFLIYGTIYSTFPFSGIYWRCNEAIAFLRIFGQERPQDVLESHAEPIQARLSDSCSP